MASKTKPYDSFGPYILFKKLEADALGDLWRAGRIDGGQLGPTVAVRRLTGGSREAMIATANAASEIVPQLTGTSFAKEQRVGVAEHTPFAAWDYQGGRSLRYIIDRARGGNGVNPNPLPLDQAIVIAEKVALSLATTADLRDGAGQRLWHGALIPQFVWITDDGEIRVAGQLLGAGIMASLATDAKLLSEIARYFPPEARTVTQPRNTDVYSLGALLFLLVTGQEPPDAATASAFVPAVRAAKTMTGAAVPDDIRVILDKSFNLDPSMRYASIGEMKQALSMLANGGRYSATTFNLAFYLSNLLKKESEAEALEREKESKVNVAPYLEAPKPAPAPMIPIAAAAPAAAAPVAAHAEPPAKSKAPIAIAAGLLVAAGLGAGGWYMLKKAPAQPAVQQTTQAQVIPAAQQPKPIVMPEPIVASGGSTETAAVASATDSAAQQKAFEDAVRAKMQAELLALQKQFEADLKKQQSKNAPVAVAPPVSVPAQEEERPTLTAAQLDQQRRETQAQAAPQQTATVPAPAPVQQQTQTTAPAPQQAQPQVAATTQTTAPVQQQPAVREGDVVGVSDLDSFPKAIRVVAPQYPPLARSQRLAANIFLSVLIDETGTVTDVRVLRGEPRFGMTDAAVRALKSTKFSPPVKDGKRVKTWLPQQIEFKP